MIRTFAMTHDNRLLSDLPIERLREPGIKWFWVDFDTPTEEQANLLSEHFGFHPMAVEDCLHALQRPKLDYFEGYDFFILHSLDPEDLSPVEVDVFLGPDFIVNFHLSAVPEMAMAHQKLLNGLNTEKGPLGVFYTVLDKIVDEYFPTFYRIEDELNDLADKEVSGDVIADIHRIRGELLKIRRIINPMRELLYRLLNSNRLTIPKEQHAYFMDVYDHLLKLTEGVESNREMTADIRDSYISINSNRMNRIMTTLTVITSVFIPLTFIASIYGMNFRNMPELTWHWGYFATLGTMLVVGILMVVWLWRKGWFE